MENQTAPDFPPVRACLFDMDGLLLDTEDIYTLCINAILEKYQRPKLPWSVKAKLQGRPGPEATKIFHDWADLPIDHAEYTKQLYALQQRHFPGTQPLPGVPRLLNDLYRTRYWDEQRASSGDDQTGSAAPSSTDTKSTTTTTTTTSPRRPHRVHIALATSSHTANYNHKTSHLRPLFSLFDPAHRILGDDPRIPRGRGKPLPDIYLLALSALNATLPADEPPITPAECLVFEDSVPGVEAGRRAGMRVVWCPHPLLRLEYAGREADVLAGRTGEAGHDVDPHQLGTPGDGWGHLYETLVGFPYERYGIVVPPEDVAVPGMLQLPS